MKYRVYLYLTTDGYFRAICPDVEMVFESQGSCDVRRRHASGYARSEAEALSKLAAEIAEFESKNEPERTLVYDSETGTWQDAPGQARTQGPDRYAVLLEET